MTKEVLNMFNGCKCWSSTDPWPGVVQKMQGGGTVPQKYGSSSSKEIHKCSTSGCTKSDIIHHILQSSSKQFWLVGQPVLCYPYCCNIWSAPIFRHDMAAISVRCSLFTARSNSSSPKCRCGAFCCYTHTATKYLENT